MNQGIRDRAVKSIKILNTDQNTAIHIQHVLAHMSQVLFEMDRKSRFHFKGNGDEVAYNGRRAQLEKDINFLSGQAEI